MSALHPSSDDLNELASLDALEVLDDRDGARLDAALRNASPDVRERVLARQAELLRDLAELEPEEPTPQLRDAVMDAVMSRIRATARNAAPVATLPAPPLRTPTEPVAHDRASLGSSSRSFWAGASRWRMAAMLLGAALLTSLFFNARASIEGAEIDRLLAAGKLEEALRIRYGQESGNGTIPDVMVATRNNARTIVALTAPEATDRTAAGTAYFHDKGRCLLVEIRGLRGAHTLKIVSDDGTTLHEVALAVDESGHGIAFVRLDDRFSDTALSQFHTASYQVVDATGEVVLESRRA